MMVPEHPLPAEPLASEHSQDLPTSHDARRPPAATTRAASSEGRIRNRTTESWSPPSPSAGGDHKPAWFDDLGLVNSPVWRQAEVPATNTDVTAHAVASL